MVRGENIILRYRKFTIIIIILIFVFSFIILQVYRNNNILQWTINSQKINTINIDLPKEEPLKLNQSEYPIIAVVDATIDEKNIYLEDTIIRGNNFRYKEALDHGTAITGIIAAHGNKNKYKGIIENAKIISIVINIDKFNIKELLKSLKVAELRGVKVVNCSFTISEYSKELYDYIKQSNMLFVCAAGNDNRNSLSYPANFDLPNIISVVAINKYGYISSNSNYSLNADIAAPGENILCIFGKNEFHELSGSSVAVPHITAACAYIIDQTGYNAIDTKKFLLQNSKQLKSLKNRVRDEKVISFSQIIKALTQK